MTPNKPTVGQTIYIGSLDEGNLKPATVVSVGRKYFKALPDFSQEHWHPKPEDERFYHKEFRLSDWKGGDREYYDAYASEEHRQQLRAAKEENNARIRAADELRKRMSSWCGSWDKLTMSQLERIKAILDEPTTPPPTPARQGR